MTFSFFAKLLNLPLVPGKKVLNLPLVPGKKVFFWSKKCVEADKRLYFGETVLNTLSLKV